MSRAEAESFVVSTGVVGAYVLRPSSSCSSGKVLTSFQGGRAKHIQIEVATDARGANYHLKGGEKMFPSIRALIDFFKSAVTVVGTPLVSPLVFVPLSGQQSGPSSSTPAEAPKSKAAVAPQPAATQALPNGEVEVVITPPLGMTMAASGASSGVFVSKVRDGGAAAATGKVRPGMRIIAVDGQHAEGATIIVVASSCAVLFEYLG